MSKPVDGVLPNGFWAKGAGIVEGCGLQQGRAQLHIKWMWSELGADGEEGDAGWPAPACTPSHPAPMLALTKVRGHGAC